MKKNDLIQFNDSHIAVFKKSRIHTVYFFGSYASERTHALSDMDFGIVLENPNLSRFILLGIYSDLYEIFSELLPREYLKRRFQLKENEFDIVFLQFVPIGIQYHAITESEVLYEKNTEQRLQFEEHVLKRYMDFQHFRELHQKAVLDRI